MSELMEEYIAQGSSSSGSSEYDCHADYSDYMDGYDVDKHNDFDEDGDWLPSEE